MDITEIESTTINLILVLGSSILNLVLARRLVRGTRQNNKILENTIRRDILDNDRRQSEIKELLFMIAGDKINSSPYGGWSYKEIPKEGWDEIKPGDPYWRYLKEDFNDFVSFSDDRIKMLKKEIKKEEEDVAYLEKLMRK